MENSHPATREMTCSQFLNTIQQKAYDVAYIVVMGTGYVVASVIAPVVSLVALPIFAAASLYHSHQHRSLYDRTLPRSAFGRITADQLDPLVTQDYTRVDGKPPKVNGEMVPTREHPSHPGRYVSGTTARPPKTAADYPFKTEDDLQWLNTEYERREAADSYAFDQKMLYAFAKALVPLFGFTWVFLTEVFSPNGASSLGCQECPNSNDGVDYWDWKDAINYHRGCLDTNLRGLRVIEGEESPHDA